jgi:hypothetical protein
MEDTVSILRKASAACKPVGKSRGKINNLDGLASREASSLRMRRRKVGLESSFKLLLLLPLHFPTALAG